jgi:hypothetical protein
VFDPVPPRVGGRQIISSHLVNALRNPPPCIQSLIPREPTSKKGPFISTRWHFW